ncbi:MAG: hypothetical protein ACI9R3_000613 [Verrucomicrobiales bacterium]|jgi:hypothetical protein
MTFLCLARVKKRIFSFCRIGGVIDAISHLETEDLPSSTMTFTMNFSHSQPSLSVFRFHYPNPPPACLIVYWYTDVGTLAGST